MAENEEEITQKKGSNIVLILVTALLLVVLIIGGAVIFLLMSPDEDESASEQTQKQEQPAKKKQHAATADVGIMYPLESFTVNLVSDGGQRYIKCRIELEQNIETLTPELDKKKAIIHDKVITVLSSKSYEEISTTKGKERLKEEIINKINDILNDGYIKNIYFTDFVIS